MPGKQWVFSNFPSPSTGLQCLFSLAFNSELSSPLANRMLLEPFYITAEEKQGISIIETSLI